MQTAENRPAERLKYTHGKGYVLYTRKREEKTFFMKKIAICGDFLGKKITGIQRVAYETVSELDKLVAKGSVVLVIPKNVKERPEYENIEVVAIHSDNGNRHFWIQWWFALYIIKNRMTALTFCNEVPILKPGIAYLHDIYYKLYPEIYRTAGEKLTRMFVLMLYRSITRRAKYVITDSETSKKEIIQEFFLHFCLIGNDGYKRLRQDYFRGLQCNGEGHCGGDIWEYIKGNLEQIKY